MRILYQDKDIILCVKPPRVLSTDEPGGVPELLRDAIGDQKADIRTVHRLDRTVSGLMVLARRSKAAAELSRQMREGIFQKEYMAVIHGTPSEETGELRDLVWRNKSERKTYIVPESGKDVQEAVLDYRVMNCNEGLTRVRIRLHTGRTHQIRAQFSGRGFPLVGDRKYGFAQDDCNIALWSYRLAFNHPYSGKPMEFTREPPQSYPWSNC